MPRARVVLPLLLGIALPAVAQVRINEVLYDGDGTDADDVFTELTGPPATSLDGWALVGVNGTTSAPYRTVDLGGAIPADGVYVVATESASEALAAVRDFVGSVDWQNGPDAVWLLDSDGSVVDALQYGSVDSFAEGEGTPAPEVSSGQSLSRDAAGTDTDDNAADFSPLDVPTPGIGPAPGGEAPDDGDDDPPPPASPTSLQLALPDTTAAGGDTLIVPVRLTDTSGLGVLATELFLTFDGDVLRLVDVRPADLLAGADWTVAAHVRPGGDAPDTLRIALATDVDTLAGAGALVQARFAVADLRQPASSNLAVEHLLLNDGGVAAATVGGAVDLVGVDAHLDVLPARASLHQPFTVTVVDADEDRDPLVADEVEVRITEGPEDGAVEQVDSLTVRETGASTGVFVGSVATLFADPVSGNGLLEVAPRRLVRLCYEDRLDALGQTTPRCRDAPIPGHDGRVEVTAVAEPGDTLWVRLVDPDLNRRPDAVDTTEVTAVDRPLGVSWTARLIEQGASDSVFVGHVPTIPHASVEALRLSAPGHVDVHYVDRAPEVGDSLVVRASTRVLNRFGDADGNGTVQAFDAAATLAHVLAPRLTADDSLAANVDSLAPFGPITPYDAALILQQRVGLRRRFPVQSAGAANHPAEAATGAHRPTVPRATDPLHVALVSRSGATALQLSERNGVVAADVTLAGVPPATTVTLAPEARGFLLRSARRGDRLRIVLAGAVDAAGPGDLLWLSGDQATTTVERVRLNDRDLPVTAAPPANAGTQPAALALYANHPNPFNGATRIPFEAGDAARASLTIHDVLGRQVRSLRRGPIGEGAHAVVWDGRDDQGRLAATGVYLARLRVDGGSATRRMLLVR